MKIRILVLSLLLSFFALFTSTAYSTLYYFQGYDTELLAVGASSVTKFTTSKLSSSGSDRTTRVYFTVEDQDIRVGWLEGSVADPGVADGILVPVGSSFEVLGWENIKNFRMIAVEGISAVNVQYERTRNLQ